MTQLSIQAPVRFIARADRAGKGEIAEKNYDHIRSKVVLMTGSQIETTLSFLDGILRCHLPNVETVRLVLGTLADVSPDEYEPDVVAQTMEFFSAHRPEIVFVSLIEFGLPRLLLLIESLRKEFTFLCVAGGPYAIEYPEECVTSGQFDVVNYSHGLHSWLIAANPQELNYVPNIMFSDGGKAGAWTRNGPSATAYSMDEVPLPYWGLENLYVLANPSWWESTAQNKTSIRHMQGSGGAYPVEHHQWPARHSGVVVLSTGCPVNTCDFCSISRMYDQEKALYREEAPDATRSLRKVSWWHPESAIRTLEQYVEARPNTRYFVFNDNDFASISKAYAKEFLTLYKDRIGLPFYCQSSPHLTLAKGPEFVSLMVEAGLDTYCMGVESNGSTNEAMYNRHGSDKLVFNAVGLFETYTKSGQIRLALDFINGNAAETREDLLGTIDLVRKLPLPWDLAIHNLTLSDDTPLSQRISRAEPKQSDAGHAAHSHDVNVSDYHHANLAVFMELKERWLNLVLQWLGGLHDEQRAGCFLRDFDAFSMQNGILEARTAHPLFDALLTRNKSFATCYDFLVDPEVIDFMQANTAIMAALYKNMPSIVYGYHEPDRYVFDWGRTGDCLLPVGD